MDVRVQLCECACIKKMCYNIRMGAVLLQKHFTQLEAL